MKNTINTIEAKMVAMEISMKELELYRDILQYIENQIAYCVGYKYDENYNTVYDENGDRIMNEEPKKGDYNYSEYQAKLNIREKIMKMI